MEYTPSSFTNFNNGFVIPYISSITAIAFWLRVSRLLVPAIGNSKFVRLIADNTYGIMVNQLVGFMCLKFVFYGLSCITSGSLFGDFNVASLNQVYGTTIFQTVCNSGLLYILYLVYLYRY